MILDELKSTMTPKHRKLNHAIGTLVSFEKLAFALNLHDLRISFLISNLCKLL